MDTRTLKVLSAILIGGLMGMVIMTSMAPNWWPLGLVVGFLGGYLSYDFRTMTQAVPKAWQTARGWNYKAVTGVAKQVFLIFVILVFTVASFFTAPIFIGIVTEANNYLAGNRVWALVFYIMFVILFFKTYLNIIYEKVKIDGSLDWRNLWDFNPVKIYFWDMPRVLVLEAIPLSARFTWHFIRLIHSELRLLCGLDAALCSMVFHYAGNNMILGLFVGLACGLLQFEILSKRVLKVVPAKMS